MKEKIIELIEEVLMLEHGTVNENSSMEDFEEWDSLAHVMIIGELESQLGIVIPLDEAIEITGVKDILEKASGLK